MRSRRDDAPAAGAPVRKRRGRGASGGTPAVRPPRKNPRHRKARCCRRRRPAERRGNVAAAAPKREAEPRRAPAAKKKCRPKKNPRAAKTPVKAHRKKAAAKWPPKAPKESLDRQHPRRRAHRRLKPGPVTKAEAAAKPQPAKPAAAAESTQRQAPVPPMPAKPEYAKPKPQAGRRRRAPRFFLSTCCFGSFMGVGFHVARRHGRPVDAGHGPVHVSQHPHRAAEQIQGRLSQRLPAGPGRDEIRRPVRRVGGERRIQRPAANLALRTVCTHLGCTPNWLEGEQKFKCPCHGSGFYKDGINFEGPAPRPLERYAIRLADDGQLEVDKSKTFQEEMGQWSDPASFVSV